MKDTFQIRKNNQIMIIIITGSRDYTDSEKIMRVLHPYSRHPQPVTLYHGDCKGADKLSHTVAELLGFTIRKFPITTSDWKRFGRGAGPIRNRKMVDMAKAEASSSNQPIIVHAFHPNLPASKGTKDCVKYAQAVGLIVRLST